MDLVGNLCALRKFRGRLLAFSLLSLFVVRSCLLSLRNKRQIFLWSRRRAQNVTSQAFIAQRTLRFEKSESRVSRAPGRERERERESAVVTSLKKPFPRRNSYISEEIQENRVPRREVMRLAKIPRPTSYGETNDKYSFGCRRIGNVVAKRRPSEKLKTRKS